MKFLLSMTGIDLLRRTTALPGYCPMNSDLACVHGAGFSLTKRTMWWVSFDLSDLDPFINRGATRFSTATNS